MLRGNVDGLIVLGCDAAEIFDMSSHMPDDITPFGFGRTALPHDPRRQAGDRWSGPRTTRQNQRRSGADLSRLLQRVLARPETTNQHHRICLGQRRQMLAPW